MLLSIVCIISLAVVSADQVNTDFDPLIIFSSILADLASNPADLPVIEADHETIPSIIEELYNHMDKLVKLGRETIFKCHKALKHTMWTHFKRIKITDDIEPFLYGIIQREDELWDLLIGYTIHIIIEYNKLFSQVIKRVSRHMQLISNDQEAQATFKELQPATDAARIMYLENPKKHKLIAMGLLNKDANKVRQLHNLAQDKSSSSVQIQQEFDAIINQMILNSANQLQLFFLVEHKTIEDYKCIIRRFARFLNDKVLQAYNNGPYPLLFI